MTSCRITASYGLDAFSSPTKTILPPCPLTTTLATSHRIFCRTYDIPNPHFNVMNALLTQDTFFIFLHNRLLSPDWSGWFQRCEDMPQNQRGLCLVASEHGYVRICAYPWHMCWIRGTHSV